MKKKLATTFFRGRKGDMVAFTESGKLMIPDSEVESGTLYEITAVREVRRAVFVSVRRAPEGLDALPAEVAPYLGREDEVYQVIVRSRNYGNYLVEMASKEAIEKAAARRSAEREARRNAEREELARKREREEKYVAERGHLASRILAAAAAKLGDSDAYYEVRVAVSEWTSGRVSTLPEEIRQYVS